MLATAELDGRGGATYRFHSAGTAAPGFVADDLPSGLPPAFTALHVGSLALVLEPIASTIEWLVASVADDVLVVADPNIRPTAINDDARLRERLDRLLARVDVVKASTEDLRWLEPSLDPVAAARALIAPGAAVVLVTDGAAPVRVVTADRVDTVAVPVVEVRDTVGAGDAFGAGFVAAWHDAGRSRAATADHAALVDAVRVAVRVGALTATRAGAEPPTRAELEAFDP
jgi:fructokinase